MIMDVLLSLLILFFFGLPLALFLRQSDATFLSDLGLGIFIPTCMSYLLARLARHVKERPLRRLRRLRNL